MLNHILLPLDGSPLAERVLPHAVALANIFHSKLTLLRVVYRDNPLNDEDIINPMGWQMRKSEAEAYLKSVKKRLAEVKIDSEIQILEGVPAQEIIEFAQNNSVNLILLSSHGKSGISAWNINSTVQKIMLRAFIPVMIIRAYQEGTGDLQGQKYHRVMCPLDGSWRAECILPLAKALSEAQDLKIFLAHIIEEPKLPRQTPLREDVQALLEELSVINQVESKRYMEEIKNQFQHEKVEIVIESSRQPAVALHNMIDRKKIDLVLLSAHGNAGENRWPYGKIALNFIAYGTTPLIVIQDLSRDEFQNTLVEKYAAQSKGH